MLWPGDGVPARTEVRENDAAVERLCTAVGRPGGGEGDLTVTANWRREELLLGSVPSICPGSRCVEVVRKIFSR